MKKHFAATVLSALALLVGAPSASAVVQYPLHVSAASPEVINASGYRARIQVRPYAPDGIPGAYTWVGGYLADGTFIQSGIEQPGQAVGPKPYAFVWVMRPGTSPITLALPAAETSDWYDFAATLDKGVWTFTVDGPGLEGPVIQHAEAGPPLQVFLVDQEFWTAEYSGAFPVGVMRAVNIRQNGAWRVPHLVFSPPDPLCGTSEIYPTHGLNLVFRPTSGDSSCYHPLS